MKIKQFKSLASNRLIPAAAAVLLLTGAHARTWTSADGAKTFDGELRSYDPAKGSITVTLPNGKAMTIQRNIGPEIGIGHHVGHVTDAPVMILKSCIGNRSLGWDLLPPGSEPYEHGGKIQPGYRGTENDPEGDTGGDMSKGWYAGCQYDGDVAAAKKVLENLDAYYPGAKKYEVAGFFWWQGDKDMRNPAHYEQYEKNLIQLIKALRQDFNAPDAKFVTASLGQTQKGSKGGDGMILDAMESVSKSSDPELKGKVAFVYTHPLSKGGSSSGHYGGNPETYMNVGEAMGKAMVELLQGK